MSTTEETEKTPQISEYSISVWIKSLLMMPKCHETCPEGTDCQLPCERLALVIALRAITHRHIQ